MSPTIDRDDGGEIELSVSFAPKDEDVFAENRAELHYMYVLENFCKIVILIFRMNNQHDVPTNVHKFRIQ